VFAKPVRAQVVTRLESLPERVERFCRLLVEINRQVG
jgi:hypothetical protein